MIRKLITVLLAVMLVGAGSFALFAGGAAADWSTNSIVESSSSATVSFTNDTATGPPVVVNNTSVSSADDLELHVFLEDTDKEVQLNTLTGFASTANADEYELDGYEINDTDQPRANGHTDVEFAVYDTAQEAYVADAGVVDYEYDSNGDDAIVHVSDKATTSDGWIAGVSSAEEKASWYGFGSNYTVADASGSVPINGSESNVTMQLDGGHADSMQNAFGDEPENGSVAPIFVEANGQPVIVFVDEAPDYAPDTHGVYDTETDEIEFTLGDERFSDSDELTYTLTTHDEPGFWFKVNQLGFFNAF